MKLLRRGTAKAFSSLSEELSKLRISFPIQSEIQDKHAGIVWSFRMQVGMRWGGRGREKGGSF